MYDLKYVGLNLRSKYNLIIKGAFPMKCEAFACMMEKIKNQNSQKKAIFL